MNEKDFIRTVLIIGREVLMSGEITYRLGVSKYGGLWVCGDWTYDKPCSYGIEALRKDHPKLHEHLMNYKGTTDDIPRARRTWQRKEK